MAENPNLEACELQIVRLCQLNEKANEKKTELAKMQRRIEVLQDDLYKQLGYGEFRVRDYILIIKKKISGGRKGVSYKSAIEQFVENLPKVAQYYNRKYKDPILKKILKTMMSKLEKDAQKFIDINTTVSEQVEVQDFTTMQTSSND